MGRVKRERPRERRLATRVIHAGQRSDPVTGAVIPPVYLTSTYARATLDEATEYTYARTINPTRRALERNLAELEGGADAACFASGMAAIAAALALLEAGDHVVATDRIYGGTYRLFEGLLRRQGLRFSWVDTSRPREVERAIEDRTRMLFVETPSNPTLRLTDLAAMARLAAGRGIPLVVDNTFMTPCLQRPLELGAQLVVHSTTKYLNGHSDSVGGCVVAATPELAERLAWVQKTVGSILSPLDSFLVLRGVKTLALRMERHGENAAAVARYLRRHPRVREVSYPGLRDHPQYRLARAQMRHPGGMIAVDVGTRARARRFLERLALFVLAESLGGVESLASYPATMTHASMTPAQRRRVGVTDGLVRLSVGIEAVEDLVADLEQALG